MGEIQASVSADHACRELRVSLERHTINAFPRNTFRLWKGTRFLRRVEGLS
jgi:hypothetical protein